MLPIDLVKKKWAFTQTFDKTGPISMEGFLSALVGEYPRRSGTTTFEIQYADKKLKDDLMSKQNGLPASVFVEINWNDNTIRTFFATQPTIGDGFYQDRRIPFYTFSTPVEYSRDGIEHYDYPAVKHGADAGAFLEGFITIQNTKRPHTQEPRHGKQGAFEEWLHTIQRMNERRYAKMGFEVFYIKKVNFWESHILNWKQGIEWMNKS